MYCPEEVCVIDDVLENVGVVESSGLIEIEAENVESPVGVGVSP